MIDNTEVTLEILQDGQWVNKVIKISVEKDFVIDENKVEGELCQAGKIMTKYGLLAAELKAQVARYKEHVESESSTVAIGIRHQASVSGSKITEAMVKEEVASHPQVRALKAALNRSELDHGKVDNMFKAIKSKVDCLIALAYHQRAELQKMGY
jgi:hypothetical protein